ncbi:MAG: malate:quinone oxidoreductase [Flavobacterium sp.]|nr:malate:quinone oxidoreductase [Candidatus Neoflavobacterium equi]
MATTTNKTEADIVLVGAGIMSATLGLLLKELQPDLTIEIYERLGSAATESSDAWNNAGTGHSAFCELNYTPQAKDGSVDISKAISICESFDNSRQFWSYLVEKGILKNPSHFIKSVPHMSFVWGDENISFLKKRYEAMQQSHFFKKMEYSENPTQIKEWAPLLMDGRKDGEKIAATHMSLGTDVNFGALTRSLFDDLKNREGVRLHFNADVTSIDRAADKSWDLEVDVDGNTTKVNGKFVFVGAGGGSLHLLQKADIPEIKGFGGFPVGGQWLRCTNPEIIKQHHAKVYGKAAVGAPPMSVPHLDTRSIDGEQALLFGPYAGFSTKFLKNGSYFDLFSSIKADNISSMLGVGMSNMDLTKYLITEVLKSQEAKVESLREFFPNAKSSDWKIEVAGQRVQVIKKDKDGKGILQFGTEVISTADGSLSGLLGASPGASTTVTIMLNLINRCFPEKAKSPEWQAKFKEMIPSYGTKLRDNAALTEEMTIKTSKVLGLDM